MDVHVIFKGDSTNTGAKESNPVMLIESGGSTNRASMCN